MNSNQHEGGGDQREYEDLSPTSYLMKDINLFLKFYSVSSILRNSKFLYWPLCLLLFFPSVIVFSQMFVELGSPIIFKS